MTQQLSGKTLLKELKKLSKSAPDASRRELAKLCGYTKTTKKGEEKINVAAFYEALLEAKGLNLGGESGDKRRGREKTYKVTVQKNGQLLIGSAYVKDMNVEPGDEFEVKLGYKNIHLVKCGEAAEA